MSQKNRKGGRPKGHPKTGGRKKGSRNKRNLRLRERFAEEGFDFVTEVMDSISEIKEPVARLEYLVRLAPYFMQRLRQEEESADNALDSLNSVPSEDEISTADLLKLVGK